MFYPTAAGVFEGYLTMVSNSQTPVSSATLSGTGVTAPAADLCPVSLTFPAQAVSTTSNAQAVILTNNGSAQLTITGITPSGDLSDTTDCTGSLPARTSCVINATFTPATSGTRTGSIIIYDDAAESPQAVNLTGTGTTTAASLPTELPLVARNDVRVVSALLNSLPKTAGYQPPRQELMQHLVFFDPNEGQFGSAILFSAHFPEYSLAIMKTGLALQLPPKPLAKPDRRADGDRRHARSEPAAPTMMTMRLMGAGPHVHAAGIRKLIGKTNYFLGNNPKRWRTNVPTYARVKLCGIYPGINLTYFGHQDRLEYDFVVAPGANPREIRLKFTGDFRLRLDKEGNLILATAAGDVRFQKPLVYQRAESSGLPARSNPKHGTRKLLDGHYILLSSNQVAFHVGRYNRRKPLVIDPVLNLSTYLGGSGGDTANAIAVDSSGDAYIAGKTGSMDFPVTSNAFLKTCGTQQNPCGFPFDYDGFVAKLSSDGSTLLYATYLGGPATYASTVINGIAVDSSGDAYLTGSTYSNNFPTTSGTFQPQTSGTLEFPGVSCAFVTKLNATGSSLVYSTYLGGTPANTGIPVIPPDGANAIALDSAGDAYVVGTTSESDFPTTPGAFQTTGPSSGNVIGFVSKLNTAGSSLVFSTFLGGSGIDELNAIAVDASGNAYVAGTANSLDFPTTPGSYQSGSFSYIGGETSPNASGVIAKFSPSGKIEYSTYLGGPNNTSISSIAVNSAGAAYVTGTTGDGFPVTPNALSSTYEVYSAFVAKLHPDGCALLYGTYLNPPAFADTENPHAIALDSSGGIYVAGGVLGISLGSYPGVNELQPEMQLSPGFVSEMDPNGTKMLFSTPLGGSGGDNNFGSEVRGMALDPGGDIYVTGTTSSQDFPVTNALEPVAQDLLTLTVPTGFVAKTSPEQATGITSTRSSLSFPPWPVDVSANAVIQAVGLQNNQSAALNISSVTTSGNGFSLVKSSNPPPACSGTIAAGAGCVVFVQFVPTTTGPITGTVMIFDDGPGSPRTIALNGEGMPDFVLDAGSPTINGGQAQYTIFASSVSGAPLSTDTADITLSCSGESPASCSFSPASIAPNGTIPNSSTLTVSNLTAVTGGSLNFSVVGTAGTQTYSLPLSLPIEDFSIAAAQASASVSPGQTASYALTVTPINGFNQSVNFSCSGAPSSAGCTVSPLSLTLDGTHAADATVTVMTRSPSFAYPRPPTFFAPPNHGIEGLFSWFLLFAAFAAVIAARRRWRMTVRVTFLVATLAFVLLWTSCGGGGGGGSGGGSSPGTLAGTYTLTVTGSHIGSNSSSLSHSVKLTLKVQ